jgi:hypothetical protein
MPWTSAGASSRITWPLYREDPEITDGQATLVAFGSIGDLLGCRLALAVMNCYIEAILPILRDSAHIRSLRR